MEHAMLCLFRKKKSQKTFSRVEIFTYKARIVYDVLLCVTVYMLSFKLEEGNNRAWGR